MKNMNNWSTRGQVVYRRSYSRPLDEINKEFETWPQTVQRNIRHQAWLWERAKGMNLSSAEIEELDVLRQLLLDRKAFTSARSLWLGGTEIARTRESSLFNCSYLSVRTVFDLVDALWLLLQGCGVGFTPVTGVLNGFIRRIDDIELLRSERKFKGGAERNTETWMTSSKTWILQIGDSAESWSKAVGKLVAGKYPAKKLILDLSQIRPAGERLKGYGWISSGDEQLSKALLGICEVMNRAAGRLLSVLDILDIVNWMGTILSSRRSAEIALLSSSNSHWREFALAKKNHYEHNPQRAQSNNSLLYYEKPSKSQLFEIFDLMLEGGGSEPGIINAEAALRRAPYYAGNNPCGEVLLGDKGFCNLTEIVLPRFNGQYDELRKAMRVVARANYRQSCVNLDDGVLQRTWHELNEYLHLCGVGVTGVVQWERHLDKTAWQDLRNIAVSAARSMAEELDLPHPALVTTTKPSGTLSKVADCTEGVHKPLGKYIFNNVNFSIHDPLVARLKSAGYRVFENPYDTTGCLVTFPVEYANVDFSTVHGKQINTETAIAQLTRYKLMMDNYIDHNVSTTISYSPGEVGGIVDWLHKNWDSYVATAFMFRNDPSKTAADMGYPYLPQEVITEDVYHAYAETLRPVDLFNLSDDNSDFTIDTNECSSGACPIR